MATGDESGKIILWRMSTRTLLEGHTGRVRTLSLSPDGETLVTNGFDGLMILWDALSGTQRQVIQTPHPRSILNGNFSPDGQSYATVSTDGTVVIWDTGSWTPRFVMTENRGMAMLDIVFSSDNRLLVGPGFDGAVEFWDAFSGESLGDPIPLYERGWIMRLVYSPDGQRIATANQNGEIRLWDAQTLAELTPYPLTHEGWVTDLVFLPDGQSLISGGGDRQIIHWDLTNFAPLGEPLSVHNSQVWRLFLHQAVDGRYVLISLGGNGDIFFHDLESRMLIGPKLVTSRESEDLAVDPQRLRFYLASFGPVASIWQLEVTNWVDEFCRITGRSLSQQEWASYLPGRPYRQTCPVP